MRRFFSAIHRFFASLFTPAGQEKITIALGQAESLVQAVMPVVEAIAAATPNRIDAGDRRCREEVPVSISVGPMTDAEGRTMSWGLQIVLRLWEPS
jgi:hypothetical protein